MPWVRQPSTWIPLYLLLAAYLILHLRLKSIVVLISAAITVLLTDQLASSVIKPLVHRPRPCNDVVFQSHVHLLVTCGSGFSFVSSHAANHFGIALFVVVLLGRKLPWLTPVAIFWAALVCFAQVYVGLHYPGDIVGGAILGSMVGFLMGKACNATLRKLHVA